MQPAWLARLRWRQRGAWLWPTFVVTVLLDGAIVHELPMIGDRQSVYGGLLAGLILNVLAVLFCSRPGAMLLRRRRPDLPMGVARNYAGTTAVLLVSAAILGVGLLHRPTIDAQQRMLDEVVARAEAYIGDRAPAAFRADASHTDTFTILAGSLYRTCVPSRDGRRTYCVIVKPRLPLAQSVVFAGYEPNWLFAQGVG
ncbi:MAG TPA: hypothetical protein VGH45_05095 [Solirubrobacteraceae bacterium]|jgi:hypothetical protein